MVSKLTKATEKPLELSEAMETVWHKTTVHIYPVSDSQLAELTAGYNSLYLILFGIFAGAAISLGITYPQLTATSGQKPYFLAALITAIGLTFMFGIAGVGRLIRASAAKKRLENTVPLTRNSN